MNVVTSYATQPNFSDLVRNFWFEVDLNWNTWYRPLGSWKP